jgi:4-diphosphocytidyl-2-C-methyl-D-erythritol kinase
VTTITVRTPAKINLHLGVGAPRPDGFHPLSTVYQAIGVYDELRARPADEMSIRVHMDGSGTVPVDERNLAVRAARLLAHEFAVDRGVELHLCKGIPVAGGMAGGSSDAAAALVACAAVWGLSIPRSRLLQLAARLGSDVPFCLVGGTAIGTGRGEQLSPVLSRGRYCWVVAAADGGLSTPAVYAELDRLRGSHPVPDPAVPDALLAALREGCPRALADVLVNDLERAALSLTPDIAPTMEVGERAGALATIVSGSGPTTLFLAEDDQHADELAGVLQESGRARSVLATSGPVPGATVIG